MYGMVNKALQSMVIDAHGEETWERIRQEAGVETEIFISNQGYPDDVTFRLAAAGAQVLQQPLAELLRSFGSYWVLNTARRGYGELMSAGGRTLQEFLLNLPNLHTRVGLIFPHLQPPEFWCTEVTDQSLRLHYRSTREGLTPFVEGLVLGLGAMFETAVEVTPVAAAHAPGRDEFLVRWAAALPRRQ